MKLNKIIYSIFFIITCTLTFGKGIEIPVLLQDNLQSKSLSECNSKTNNWLNESLIDWTEPKNYIQFTQESTINGTKVNAKTPDGCLIWTQQITSHTKQVMAVYYDTYNPTTSFYISSNGSFFYNHSNKIMELPSIKQFALERISQLEYIPDYIFSGESRNIYFFLNWVNGKITGELRIENDQNPNLRASKESIIIMQHHLLTTLKTSELLLLPSTNILSRIFIDFESDIASGSKELSMKRGEEMREYMNWDRNMRRIVGKLGSQGSGMLGESPPIGRQLFPLEGVGSKSSWAEESLLEIITQTYLMITFGVLIMIAVLMVLIPYIITLRYNYIQLAKSAHNTPTVCKINKDTKSKEERRVLRRRLKSMCTPLIESKREDLPPVPCTVSFKPTEGETSRLLNFTNFMGTDKYEKDIEWFLPPVAEVPHSKLLSDVDDPIISENSGDHLALMTSTNSSNSINSTNIEEENEYKTGTPNFEYLQEITGGGELGKGKLKYIFQERLHLKEPIHQMMSKQEYHIQQKGKWVVKREVIEVETKYLLPSSKPKYPNRSIIIQGNESEGVRNTTYYQPPNPQDIIHQGSHKHNSLKAILPPLHEHEHEDESPDTECGEGAPTFRETDEDSLAPPSLHLHLTSNELERIYENKSISPKSPREEEKIGDIGGIGDVDNVENIEYIIEEDKITPTPTLIDNIKECGNIRLFYKEDKNRTYEPKQLLECRFERLFERLEFVGKGGFGEVYKVRYRLDDALYAVKKVNLHLGLNMEIKDHKAYRELFALQNMNHPNIVRYFTVWVELAHNYLKPPRGNPNRPKTKSKLVNGTQLELGAHLDMSEVGFEWAEECSGNTGNTGNIGNRGNTGNIGNRGNILENENNSIENSSEPTPSYSESSCSIGSNNSTNKEGSSSSQMTQTLGSPSPGEPTYKAILHLQMEYCDGQSLKQFLSRRVEVSRSDNYRYFSQMLLALDHLHSHGLIHRDLKPANIFITKENILKLGDFGLAVGIGDEHIGEPSTSTSDESDKSENSEQPSNNHSSNISRSHSTPPVLNKKSMDAGTRGYSAPEQMTSLLFDEKVDMYSLGLILLELSLNFTTYHYKMTTFNNLKDGQYLGHELELPHLPEVTIMRKLVVSDARERSSARELLNGDDMKTWGKQVGQI